MPRIGQSIVFYRGTAQDRWHGEDHYGELGCYFCKPENFPPMLTNCSLCCCCGNVIVMPDDTDPMNEAMLACVECEERFEEDRRAENARQEPGAKVL